MKQNKNSSVIRFLSFLTALFVFVISFSFPAFAVTNPPSTNGIDFSEQPLPYYVSANLVDGFNNSFLVSSQTFGSGVTSGTGFLCTTPDVECFVTYSGNYAYFGSSSPCSIRHYYCDNINSPSSGNIQTSTISLSYNSSYGICTSSISVGGANIFVPTFNNSTLALNALADRINNPPCPPVAPAAVAQFILPAGNAVVIDLGAWDNANPDKKIQLSQTTQYVHPLQWSTNQFYAYSDSMPSSISTPFSGQNAINWYGNGKTNLFNQTNSFVANFIYNTSLGRYLVIINPFVPEDHDTDNYNSPLSVYVGQCSGYKFFQLKTDVSQFGAFGGESDGTTGTGVYDPNSGTWSVTNDQTGDVWAPSQGGGNSNNVVSTVSGWLEQISHQISDFFSGAIGAVTNLVSAGSDFIHSLSGLYAWLPGPVYSVLVSALILVITVGVIKVFI